MMFAFHPKFFWIYIPTSKDSNLIDDSKIIIFYKFTFLQVKIQTQRTEQINHNKHTFTFLQVKIQTAEAEINKEVNIDLHSYK